MSDTTPETPGAGAADDGRDPLERPGSRLGRYRLGEVLGEGGFGLVYRAEQLEPVRREVALKIIKAGMDTREVIARFEAERQALALMEHPGIARVLDAGATETGRPFFVMELVRGAPLNEWCDAQALPVPERLRLFAQVCEAVQHAHQKGVVHRDLKPTNVLVTEEDGGPSPKVIDFGVAKAMEGPLVDSSLVTQAGQILGTPLYMSPEQAAGRVDAVDTRSDVYSLGVLLYELLTGTLPFEPGRLQMLGRAKAQQVLLEEEPPRPSTRLSTLGDAASEAASARGLGTTLLARSLRGDLDWIVMKALEKDPDRRYASAHALALDLERHLAHEPVSAGPPGAAYQARKLFRRHRGLVTSVAAVFVALLLGAVGLTVGLLEVQAAHDELAEAHDELNDAHDELAAAHTELESAHDELAERSRELEHERDRARAAELLAAEEAEAMRQTQEFLTRDLLGAVDPDRLGHDVTVREVYELASRNAALRFFGRPRVEALLRDALADGFVHLGEPERALQEVERTAELWEQLGGGVPGDAGSLSTRGQQAQVLHGVGRLPESAALYREVIAEATDELGAEDPFTLEMRNGLAICLGSQGRLAEAEAEHRAVLAARTRVLGAGHLHTRLSAGNLGQLLRDVARYDEALEFLQRAVGDDDPAAEDYDAQLFMARSHLGALHFDRGEMEEAARYAEENLALSRRVLGDDHPSTGLEWNNLGIVRQEQGRIAEASRLYDTAREIVRARLGDDHVETLVITGNLASTYGMLGQHERSLELRGEVLAAQRRALGDDHPDTLSSLNSVAVSHWGLGNLDEARVHYEEALAGQRRTLGPEHPSTLVTLENLGGLHFTRGELEASAAICEEVLAGRRAALGDDHPDVAKTLLNLGIVREAQGLEDDARRLLTDADARFQAHFGRVHDRRALALKHLGGLQLDAHEDDRAADTYREAILIQDELLPAGDAEHGFLRHQLSVALRRLEAYEEAAEVAAEAVALRRHGDSPEALALSLYSEGTSLVDLGRHDEAVPLLRESAELFLEVEGPAGSRARTVVERLAEALDHLAAASGERAGEYEAEAAGWRLRLVVP